MNSSVSGGSQRGGVEECGEFCIIYVNVGKGKNSKYKNDFWIDRAMARDDAEGSVLMSWFSGTGPKVGRCSMTPGLPQVDLRMTPG